MQCRRQTRTTVKEHHLLSDPGTPGTLRAQYRVCLSAEQLLTGVVFATVAVGVAPGSALVVDATQSVGAADFDVRRIQPDFLVCAAYKWLLCPYGAAFMYAHPRKRLAAKMTQKWWERAGKGPLQLSRIQCSSLLCGNTFNTQAREKRVPRTCLSTHQSGCGSNE